MKKNSKKLKNKQLTFKMLLAKIEVVKSCTKSKNCKFCAHGANRICGWLSCWGCWRFLTSSNRLSYDRNRQKQSEFEFWILHSNISSIWSSSNNRSSKSLRFSEKCWLFFNMPRQHCLARLISDSTARC